jgi:hypothetical protein
MAIHRSGNSSKQQFINGFFIECTNISNFQNCKQNFSTPSRSKVIKSHLMNCRFDELPLRWFVASPFKVLAQALLRVDLVLQYLKERLSEKKKKIMVCVILLSVVAPLKSTPSHFFPVETSFILFSPTLLLRRYMTLKNDTAINIWVEQ